ncbi:MAG: TIGR00266 family protein [Flavobacteriales bacterium]|nr:TIGR00266 family protein [Flavobacteriales bacterium]
MKIEIKGKPAFAYAEVTLEPGEQITTESDAMASMSADLEVKARLNGGLIKGLLRKYLGGESLFINDFSNEGTDTKSLTITQATPGDMVLLDLTGEEYCFQPGAYIASTPGVKLGLKYAGLGSFIGREGLFKLVVSGTGQILFGAYGAIIEKEVSGEYIVDTSHLVGYQPNMKLKTQLAGGLISSITSGEGLVTRVEGTGTIYLQSRSLDGFKSFINSHLRWW